MPGIRGDIIKAITRSQKRAGTVVPFPKQAKGARVKKPKRPKAYKRITHWQDDTYVATRKKGKGQVETDHFKKVTINGKPYMRREDGALFQLRKDGTWTLVREPSAGGRRKAGGRVLPYAIAAAAGAGTAGGIYYASQQKRRK